MKTLALALVLLLPAAFVTGGDSVAKTTITIKGLTCGGCAAAVKLQLKRTTGVTAYDVSWEKGEAEVSYDPAKTDPKKIAESIAKTGFKATVKEHKPAAMVEESSLGQRAGGVPTLAAGSHTVG